MPSITELLTADDMSDKVKGVVSAERLLELAESQMIPHYIVDDRIMFGPGETKEWLNHNLVVRVPGAHLGDSICRVVNVVEPLGDKAVPPVALRAIAAFLIPMGLESIKTVPFSGVYFLCHRGEVVYVGQSVNVLSRVGQHFGSKTFDSVFFMRIPKSDLNFVEGTFIRTLTPKYNMDKSGRIVAPSPTGYCSPEGEKLVGLVEAAVA